MEFDELSDSGGAEHMVTWTYGVRVIQYGS